jgi:membrane protease YdiL (CAAX protease family)
VVADHPAAVVVAWMFAVGYGLLIPATAAGLPPEPFLLGVVLLGQLLPALLVTAARGGRRAVRELVGRVFRWRTHPVWYLVALLGIPVASLLASAAVFGNGALHTLVTDPGVITGYLAALTILPVVNLWEETAWTGVVQSHLAAVRGPVVAAVLTGLLFGLVHLPLQIGAPPGQLAIGVLVLMAACIPFRIVLWWVYARTGGSVLLVALGHVTFNATNNTALLTAAAPGDDLVTATPWAVVGLTATALLVVTRGRLHTLGGGSEHSPAPPARWARGRRGRRGSGELLGPADPGQDERADERRQHQRDHRPGAVALGGQLVSGRAGGGPTVGHDGGPVQRPGDLAGGDPDAQHTVVDTRGELGRLGAVVPGRLELVGGPDDVLGGRPAVGVAEHGGEGAGAVGADAVHQRRDLPVPGGEVCGRRRSGAGRSCAEHGGQSDDHGRPPGPGGRSTSHGSTSS